MKRKKNTETETRKEPRSKKKIILRILIILLVLAVLASVSTLIINSHVKKVGGENIISPEEAAALEDVDCIIVLGCKVQDDGVPSNMLYDRIRRGVELYQAGAAPKILMSGDHGQVDYDEVNTMKRYAIDMGVPSEDVFMDHAGFSTYETMYRARDVFLAKKVLIVTQEYHLYRAAYAAEALGLEAYGVACDYRTYSGQSARDAREILARCKDYFTAIIKPKPTYLGEPIPISGSGDLTND